jgi:tetratricopeptide (TPR) repeat protein
VIRSRLERHQPLAAIAGRSERQRTMTAAIGWSYDLLESDERAVFARLSAFPAGCTLDAAEVVCDAGDLGRSVLDGIAALVTKGLVRQEEGLSETEPRFGMLEPIAEYSGERLHADFDAGPTYRRLLGFFVTFAEEAGRRLTSREQAAWLDRCERERGNVRRAVEWAVEDGEVDLGIRVASAVWRFWQLRGPLWEGRQLLDALLAAPNASPALRARALGAAGGLAWWANDLAGTTRHYEEAMTIAAASGDERVEMEALRNLAFVRVASGSGGVEAARSLLDKSTEIAERLGDRLGAARARNATGFITALFTRDYTRALSVFQQSIADFEELGEQVELGDTIVSIGNVLRRMGQLERARDHYLRGLDMAIEAGNRPVATGLLSLVAALESDAGRHERAVRLWAAAESLRAASGAVRPAVAHRLLGDPVASAREAMGDEAVDAAVVQGERLDYETALNYAHGDDDSFGP